jgi:hypothetical protein
MAYGFRHYTIIWTKCVLIAKYQRDTAMKKAKTCPTYSVRLVTAIVVASNRASHEARAVTDSSILARSGHTCF